MAIISDRMTKRPIDRGPPGERQAYARLFVALTIAAGSVFGCGDPREDVENPREDVETVQSALSASRSFTFGGIQRVLSTVCGKKCVKLVATPGPPGSLRPTFTCGQYAPDCTLPVSGALYADSAALASGVIFPEFNEGPSWQYSGCGPQAVMNVLNYYGVQMPIAEVEQHVPTFALVAGGSNQSIATYPDDVKNSLQELLNNRVAANHFVVSRWSGVQPSIEIPNAINSGNPIILLVNGGDHIQVATGYDQTRAYVIDYAGQGQWRNQSDLGMKLSTFSSVFSTISGVAALDGGFDDYTIITIKYVNEFMIYDPPRSSNVAATVCNVDGSLMHCCPKGYAMVGADWNNNIFSCGPLDTPGILGPPTLDAGTVRNNMHACPFGQVMVGLRLDWNLLACQALPAGSVTGEVVDSSTQNGYPMHACGRGNPNTAAMSGIHADQNLLTCATTNRIR